MSVISTQCDNQKCLQCQMLPGRQRSPPAENHQCRDMHKFLLHCNKGLINCSTQIREILMELRPFELSTLLDRGGRRRCSKCVICKCGAKIPQNTAYLKNYEQPKEFKSQRDEEELIKRVGEGLGGTIQPYLQFIEKFPLKAQLFTHCVLQEVRTLFWYYSKEGCRKTRHLLT